MEWSRTPPNPGWEVRWTPSYLEKVGAGKISNMWEEHGKTFQFSFRKWKSRNVHMSAPWPVFAPLGPFHNFSTNFLHFKLQLPLKSNRSTFTHIYAKNLLAQSAGRKKLTFGGIRGTPGVNLDHPWWRGPGPPLWSRRGTPPKAVTLSACETLILTS